jgi:hypothetical protein
MKDRIPQRSGRSHLVFGIVLLLLGTAMLLMNLGYQLPAAVWSYYPLPLILLGLWGLIHPTRHLNRSGACWLLAAGIYCLVSTFQLFGLNWGLAWPIFVIAGGLSMIFRRYEREDRVMHET